jgi:hypothetical protein
MGGVVADTNHFVRRFRKMMTLKKAKELFGEPPKDVSDDLYYEKGF